MNKRHYAVSVVLMSLVAGYVPALATAFDDPTTTRITDSSGFKQAFYALSEDLAEAKEDHERGLLTFISIQGCSYCRLQRSFADPVLTQRPPFKLVLIGMAMPADAASTDWRGKTLPAKSCRPRTCDSCPLGAEGRCIEACASGSSIRLTFAISR